MHARAMIARLLFAVFRRGLVLMAVLSFLLTSMASIHTAHAVSAGHNSHATGAMAQDEAAGHCESHEQKAPDAQQDKQSSCCAFACAPLMVLAAAFGFAGSPIHGGMLTPLSERLVMDRQIAGLFRPPRSLA